MLPEILLIIQCILPIPIAELRTSVLKRANQVSLQREHIVHRGVNILAGKAQVEVDLRTEGEIFEQICFEITTTVEQIVLYFVVIIMSLCYRIFGIREFRKSPLPIACFYRHSGIHMPGTWNNIP